jgi:hypothetical protein
MSPEVSYFHTHIYVITNLQDHHNQISEHSEMLSAVFARLILWNRGTFSPSNHKVFFFSLALQLPWALAFNFQFHDYFTDGRTPWTSDQLVARPLPKHMTTQTQNKHIYIYIYQTSTSCVGFEPKIQASERAKTVHALDRSATVTGNHKVYRYETGVEQQQHD